MIPGVAHRRQFKNLSEQEVLALAISSEEDDARIYRWYAQRLRADYPQSAQMFMSPSFTTGCSMLLRRMAAARWRSSFSVVYLALCTPITIISSWKRASSSRNCGMTCRQLIQP